MIRMDTQVIINDRVELLKEKYQKAISSLDGEVLLECLEEALEILILIWEENPDDKDLEEEINVAIEKLEQLEKVLGA